MSKFTYIGDCAAGFVSFQRPHEDPVVMPQGESVEVPKWLADKLESNHEFEQDIDGAKVVAKKANKKVKKS